MGDERALCKSCINRLGNGVKSRIIIENKQICRGCGYVVYEVYTSTYDEILLVRKHYSLIPSKYRLTKCT
jgi:RNase P subunit RPR2